MLCKKCKKNYLDLIPAYLPAKIPLWVHCHHEEEKKEKCCYCSNIPLSYSLPRIPAILKYCFNCGRKLDET